MTANSDPAYDALERIFHEPNRLAIMSALCGADGGMTFGEIREMCRLTDDNLNRHLKVLEDDRVVKVSKTFVANKPRTMIALTAQGLKRFTEYLTALETVLEQARQAIPQEARPAATAALAKALHSHA